MAFTAGQNPYQWVFQEYPKMVYKDQSEYPHKGTIVNGPEEELAHLGYLEKDRYPKIEPMNVGPQDTGERKFLVALLTKIHAKFNEDAPIQELRDILEACSNQPEDPQASVEGAVAPLEPIPPVAPAIDPLDVLAGKTE